MNLRNATTLLILGLSYTLLHKIAFAVVPSLRESGLPSGVASILWVAATCSLIVFAFYFLKELSPLPLRFRVPLVSIMVLIGIIILERMPFVRPPISAAGERLVSSIIRLLNSAAILTFLISLNSFLSARHSLRRPTRMAIGGYALGMLLGLVSTGYYAMFLVTGSERVPFPGLQPLSAVMFLYTNCAFIWFLIIFRRIEDYSALGITASSSAGTVESQHHARMQT